MGTNRVRYFSEFFSAIKNEVAVDEYLLVRSGVGLTNVPLLPRVPKWIAFYKSFPIFFLACSLVFSMIFALGGAVGYFFVEFVYSLFYGRNKLDIDSRASFVLAFSSRAGDIVNKNNINNVGINWIVFPWAPIFVMKSENRYFHVYGILSPLEKLQALFLAVASVYVVVFKAKRRRHLLQTYTAWRWFVVRIALGKLKGDLLTVEHYDRWAVLADRVAWQNRASLGSKLTLMQHGVVGSLDHNKEQHEGRMFRPKTRLYAVKNLHVYDLNAERYFKDFVLSPGCLRRGVAVTYFKPVIELASLPATDKQTVLLVGHPLCERFHMALFKCLSLDNSLAIYYKPHPMAGMSSDARDTNWEIIEGRDVFPKVGLIVSYPSTLVEEYAQHGVPAVTHPMDCSIERVDEVYNCVRDMINSKFGVEMSSSSKGSHDGK